ncbi:hypothetical protein HNY73_014242 [Argiope bruennichi]|uniref:Uncharacterized protein n=1 Tax=Argiope bruennichi TaxID=94029 RepID=A0A8T0EQ18_ARGBR|nr:hypothetical protein HNY73_014242 [Argiope bruennichi]
MLLKYQGVYVRTLQKIPNFPSKDLIPRLELLSCTIGARLAKATISKLVLENIPTLLLSRPNLGLSYVQSRDRFLSRSAKVKKSAIPCLPKSDSPSTMMIPDRTPTSSDSCCSRCEPTKKIPLWSLLKPSVLLDSFVWVVEFLYGTQRWESAGNKDITGTRFD